MAIDRFVNENEFLSNFYKCEVVYDGIKYRSSEHAYQAAKSNDYEVKLRIASLDTAREAKAMGKRIEVRKNWEDVKLYVMETILREKFRNTDLIKKLLNTGNEELIEGNFWGDTFWGIFNGNGENHLGKLLMKVRSYLSKNKCRKCGNELDTKSKMKHYEVCQICFARDYTEFCDKWVETGHEDIR